MYSCSLHASDLSLHVSDCLPLGCPSCSLRVLNLSARLCVPVLALRVLPFRTQPTPSLALPFPPLLLPALACPAFVLTLALHLSLLFRALPVHARSLASLWIALFPCSVVSRHCPSWR